LHRSTDDNGKALETGSEKDEDLRKRLAQGGLFISPGKLSAFRCTINNGAYMKQGLHTMALSQAGSASPFPSGQISWISAFNASRLSFRQLTKLVHQMIHDAAW
jgi:hypothetical protein